MRYQHIVAGTFQARPNRFIARVTVNGQDEICHVKNTGRCAELLVPGARVYLESFPPDCPRKTKFDLVAVKKGTLLINMDSQAPNRAFGEFLRAGQLPALPAPTLVKAECAHGSSRFDFYAEQGSRRAFLEVKGVTLEEEGLALFPDAPTLRGIKHIRELALAAQEGFEAYAVFVVQMKGVHAFAPNLRTHPAFGQALQDARAAGVHILAYDCRIAPDAMAIGQPVPVLL